MRANHHLLAFVASIGLVAGMAIPGIAQSTSDVDQLADRTAQVLLKTKLKVLLIAPRETCNLAKAICEIFNVSLRADLQHVAPDIQVIGHTEAVTELKKNGFGGIDAYNPMALRLVALSVDAASVVTEDLLWEKDGYELRIDIHEAKTDERLNPFRTLELKAPRSIPDTPDNSMLVTDPDNDVAVIVFKGPLPKGFIFPGCVSCPDPKSIGSVGQVQVIGTITAQGRAESVSVVNTPSPAFTNAALATLKGWQFRPAIGLDGKAFATRSSIEVNFPR